MKKAKQSSPNHFELYGEGFELILKKRGDSPLCFQVESDGSIRVYIACEQEGGKGGVEYWFKIEELQGVVDILRIQVENLKND